MRSAAIKKLLWLTFYSLPLIAFAANFTEPRGEVSKAQSKPEDSRLVKMIVHRSRRASLASLSRSPASSLPSRSARPTTQEVKAYVRTQAVEYGVNPQLALWIVKHESQFNPRAKGDGEASRGLWQISKIYHPEVSDAAAFNVASSTQWSLGRIRSGKVNEWSSYRYCKTLYDDCPY
jgi:soluble lytic murein transglycosylase-like protein